MQITERPIALKIENRLSGASGVGWAYTALQTTLLYIKSFRFWFFYAFFAVRLCYNGYFPWRDLFNYKSIIQKNLEQLK